MTGDDPRRVADLFERAVELPAEERAAFLAAACPGEDGVRREVEALLAADAALEAGAGAPFWSGADARRPEPPRRVGPYRLVRRLGEGGMSEVFLGVRDDGELDRQVAVKLIRPELVSPEMVRRFEVERQILASLDHPAIARLLDAGRTAEGVPYFLMERIDGEPIDQYCDRHRLAIPERLRLFREVCLAVHSAHQNLVVHRDVKPSNILVTAAGQPKLLDFGIAKLLNPGLAARGHEPTAGAGRLLTPEYASPEQILGRPVTPASDVYSLGVLLYRLLAGSGPYGLGAGAPEGLERAILGEAPEAPSARVRRRRKLAAGAAGPAAGELAALRSTRPRALARALSGDLDAIVARALRKEPQQRYPSAGELAEDLRRHLAGERIAAAGDAGARRLRWAVAGAAAMAVAALAALAVQTVRLERERVQAERGRAESRDLLRSLEGLLQDSGADGEAVERIAGRLRSGVGDRTETAAGLAMAAGRAHAAAGRLDEAAAALQQALDIRRELWGAEHPSVAASLSALARVEALHGDFDSAEELHRRALAILRARIPGPSLDEADLLADLGRVLLADGHAPLAEPLLLEALAMRQVLLGEADGRIAESLADLGLAVAQLDSPSAAESLLRRAEKIERRNAGGTSWERAAILVHRAAALLDLGRREEALADLGEAGRIALGRCGGEGEVAAGLAALARAATPAAEPCRLPPLPAPRLDYLRRDLGRALREIGQPAAGDALLAGLAATRRPEPPPQPERSPPGGPCLADGAFAMTLGPPCCSGAIARGTTRCADPHDWGGTWRSCRHVCGTRLEDGCVPPGGVTDTLGLTDCCRGAGVAGSTRCLEPADFGTTWRTCVHDCA